MMGNRENFLNFYFGAKKKILTSEERYMENVRNRLEIKEKTKKCQVDLRGNKKTRDRIFVAASLLV